MKAPSSPSSQDPGFSLLVAEHAAAAWPPCAGSERHADLPGQELHPALPRLLQVSMSVQSDAALSVVLAGAG